MTAYFVDSSAGVKIYVTEGGSRRMLSLVDTSKGNELFVAQVTIIEIAAALFRRTQTGGPARERASLAVATLRDDLQRSFRTVELSSAITDEAIAVAERHGLRGYDCIQLACALFLGRTREDEGLSRLTVLSADHELNAAAKSEGIDVENPDDDAP